ncbi:hypothetical protein BTTOUR_21525 [Bacillus thuringiensis serovar toumanoffi]|uniref:Uncharacterized protein n=2 Tax=Bacillaceae TaxID=186817 RepID=A0ABD5I246_BACTU|nr:hypothetical protein [Bacillus thuringiensis serovar toumanoffi]HEB2439422.1 hypothetical protein [Bacillus thuringiensis]
MSKDTYKKSMKFKRISISEYSTENGNEGRRTRKVATGMKYGENTKLVEEVERDLEMCALNRLVNGKVDNFYEKVFKVYKMGGWPCGWKGEYMEGKMIIYLPNEK